MLAGALPLVVFAWAASRFVSLNPLETDEGFYGIAARYAAAGEWIYRDFAFNQTHLFPYLHGTLLRWTGFGLFTHRALCAAYGGLAVTVVALPVLSPRRTFAFGVAAWTLALSLLFVARTALGQSFPMAAMFLGATGAALLWAPDAPLRGAGRTWLLALLGTFAIACKLTVAPAVFVLWLAHALRLRRPVTVIAPVITAALVFLPVVLPAPSQWWFWNVGFHLGLSAIDFRSAEAYRDHLRMGPGVLLLAGVALWAARRRRPGDVPEAKSAALAVVVAALGAWAIQLPLKSTQGEYAVLFLPLLALGAAELLSQSEPSRRSRWALGAIPLVGLLGGLPPTAAGFRQDLEAAVQVLRTQVPMDRVLVTSVPAVALESGHPLLRGLEMCPFCVTAELEPQRAASLNLVTPERLTHAVQSREIGAVVLTAEASTWDFFWSVPSLAAVDEPHRAVLFEAISQARFHPVLRNAELTVMVPDASRPPAPPFWAPNPQRRTTVQ